MFENRISERFQPTVTVVKTYGAQAASPAAQFMPLASLEDIYQAAFARARDDHELDKLFNPEHYGDHGSGIEPGQAIQLAAFIRRRLYSL